MLTKSDAAITLISVFGIIGSVLLAYREITYGNYCPEFMGIPSCYLVLLAYFMVLVSVLAFRKLLYSVGTFLGLTIAIWFTIQNYSGNILCPTFRGIPLCYASLVGFSIILVLGLLRNE
jgi:hypothetical protein